MNLSLSTVTMCLDVFHEGAITVVDQLDYETRKRYDLTLRATDILTGSYAECIVHVNIQVV